jgi:hypothetical protein
MQYRVLAFSYRVKIREAFIFGVVSVTFRESNECTRKERVGNVNNFRERVPRKETAHKNIILENWWCAQILGCAVKIFWYPTEERTSRNMLMLVPFLKRMLYRKISINWWYILWWQNFIQIRTAAECAQVHHTIQSLRWVWYEFSSDTVPGFRHSEETFNWLLLMLIFGNYT